MEWEERTSWARRCWRSSAVGWRDIALGLPARRRSSSMFARVLIVSRRRGEGVDLVAAVVAC